MMLFAKTCLGVYPVYPHYYVVAFAQDGHEFQFLWQQRYLFSHPPRFQRSYVSMSLPWSMCKLSVLNHESKNRLSQRKYLGLASGEPRWLDLDYVSSERKNYLDLQGPWVSIIDTFELDILALWSYAYWLLPRLKAENQRVLWIFEYAEGTYYFYGRDENLWEMRQDLNFDAWPPAERVISFNAQSNSRFLRHLSLEYLSHSHYGWVMAFALAIRGAYAVF